VFAPSQAELYSDPQGDTVQPPAALADIVEGQVRPGFFTGIGTVVRKLFNTAQPRWAVFGKKDDQQLMVVHNMVRQLALPTDILGGETRRTEDGMALSSRNGFLATTERSKAMALGAAPRCAASGKRCEPVPVIWPRWKSRRCGSCAAVAGCRITWPSAAKPTWPHHKPVMRVWCWPQHGWAAHG